MNLDGALIREHDRTFGVLVVKPADFSDWQRRRSLRQHATSLWGDVPIVFSSRDGKGRPTYQGAPELVRLLSRRRNQHLPVRRWKTAA